MSSGDMLIGLSGSDAKVVFLVDFGMCRTYVTKDKNGNTSIRPPREKAFVRGILRYVYIFGYSAAAWP